MTLIAGTLLLGACGDRVGTDDATPAPQQQVVSASVSEDARKARLRFATVSLAELRESYTTAGTEVPPADLTRASDADKIRASKLHTGIPRAELAEQQTGWRPRGNDLVDGARLGWLYQSAE